MSGSKDSVSLMGGGNEIGNGGLQVYTTLKIFYVDGDGKRKRVSLMKGPRPNFWYALFPVDDVDFEFVMDHSTCLDRTLHIQCQVHQVQKRFVSKGGEIFFLPCLESNGRKFHFRSQETLGFQSFPPLEMMENSRASQIKFGLVFSKKFERTHPTTFVGKILRQVKIWKWRRFSDWTMYQFNLGGQGALEEGGFNYKGTDSKEFEEWDEKEKAGQLGLISFGERSEVKYRPANVVVPPDEKIKIEPITIEVRLAPKNLE